MLNTKSVKSPIRRKADGLRILATRFRGRYMRTSRYDVWMPSLGPSERLFKAARAGTISWAKFAAGYRAELFMDGPIDSRSRSIKNHGQKFTLRLVKRLVRARFQHHGVQEHGQRLPSAPVQHHGQSQYGDWLPGRLQRDHRFLQPVPRRQRDRHGRRQEHHPHRPAV